MLTQHVREFNDFCKVTKNQSSSASHCGPAAARGFLRTRMTESPRRNILEMNLSLLTGLAFFLPLPVFGSSVHISLTPSRTMLQCLSNAFTLPSNFLLFLQLISTCVLFFTESVSTLKGPVWNSSCSLASLSSGVISFLLLMMLSLTFLPTNLRGVRSMNEDRSWVGLDM